jgi:hypothetical protein
MAMKRWCSGWGGDQPFLCILPEMCICALAQAMKNANTWLIPASAFYRIRRHAAWRWHYCCAR